MNLQTKAANIPRKIRKIKKSRGFTLIEMMMVVSIIGLLTSIATPAFRQTKLDAQAVKRATITRAVELAKYRCVINGDAVAGYVATYGVFKKYLTIGGVTSPPISTLTMGDNNKAGYNIVFWGTFGLDKNGTNFHSEPRDTSMQFQSDPNWAGSGPITLDNENYEGGTY